MTTKPAPETIVQRVNKMTQGELEEAARLVIEELKAGHKEDWCAAGQVLIRALKDTNPNLAGELKRLIDQAHTIEEIKMLTLKKMFTGS